MPNNKGFKMDQEQNDDNTGTESTESTEAVESANSTGASPDVAMQAKQIDDDLFSTTEFEPVEKEKPAETETLEAETSDDAEKNTSKDAVKKDKGFHDHPDWQKMRAEKDAAIKKAADLEAKFNAIQAQKQTQPEHTQAQKRATSRLLAMKDDDLVERIGNDPKGFITDMFGDFVAAMDERQSLQEQQKAAQAQQAIQAQEQAKVKKALDDLFDGNQEARQLLKDGKIHEYLKDNPGRSAFDAYNELTRESRESALIKDAVEKAKAEIYQTLKAKGNVNLSAATGTGIPITDNRSAEVKNPEKFGGAKAVAAARFKARLAG